MFLTVPKSLTNDEVYALVACILSVGNLPKDASLVRNAFPECRCLTAIAS
jgi:hypothetical protein